MAAPLGVAGYTVPLAAPEERTMAAARPASAEVAALAGTERHMLTHTHMLPLNMLTWGPNICAVTSRTWTAQTSVLIGT